MENVTQASQQTQGTELTAAQDTITRIAPELATSHKESDGKTKKLEGMTRKLDDMTKESDVTNRKLDDTIKKLDEMTKELREERRHKEYLQGYIIKLQAKHDSIKRHADQQEADHAELQTRLEDTEERLNQACRLKNQAVAKALQDQSHRIEKDKETRYLTRELTVLTEQYQDTQKKLCQARHPELTALTRADQKSTVEGTRRVVQCTQCYTKKWPCYGGDTCKACTARGIGQNCRRVKCQFWARGSCKKGQCGFAHEDDGYPSVLEHCKLHQKAIPMPEAVERAISNITFPRHMDTDPDPEGGRLLIFETFTVLPEFSMRSLEEARYGEYMLGNLWERLPAK